MPKEEQINLIKDLERKETEFMRLKRHKICVDDFDLLTIIGRGAFGEVRMLSLGTTCCFGLLIYITICWLPRVFYCSYLFCRFDCVGRRNLEIFLQ